jgi:hypothetical protein
MDGHRVSVAEVEGVLASDAVGEVVLGAHLVVRGFRWQV